MICIYIKTKSFTNIVPGNIIYCMFQAAHTLNIFPIPGYTFEIIYRAWAFNLINRSSNLKKAIKTYIIHNEMYIGYNS